MKSFSFIFAGTSGFALECLKLLTSLDCLKLKAVISQPDSVRGRGMKNQSSLVKAYAQEQNLPVWTPHKASDSEFLKEIKKQDCDFSFVCAYGQILPLAYLQLFPKGSLNLHLSLLPLWRGAAPIQRALMAGDQKTGVCLQIMTEELDAGDIISQREFKIQEEDNAEDLFTKALKETKDILTKDLSDYLKGNLQAQAQNHSKASYASKIKKSEGKIIWEESSTTIHNKIRALFLGPQAFSFLQGKRVKFYRSRPLKKDFPGFAPGEICHITKEQVFVACGQGTLSLLELQKEGKKKQSLTDFLKGQKLKLKDSWKS